MNEKCQRCGEEGQDRRTLWMACFYEMMELGMPFSISQAANSQKMYTLRVCKGCRAEWMDAIKAWFMTPRSPDIDEDGIIALKTED